jgi:hypothetical protein
VTPSSYSAFVRARFANAVLRANGGAEQLFEQAEADGASENIRFQHLRRVTRAKLLADRGETEAARLAGPHALQPAEVAVRGDRPAWWEWLATRGSLD